MVREQGAYFDPYGKFDIDCVSVRWGALHLCKDLSSNILQFDFKMVMSEVRLMLQTALNKEEPVQLN